MLDTYGNTNKSLVALAQEASGLRYDSAEAEAILGREDWADHWPVCDAEGHLTGDVVETDDCEGYASVANEAMVAIADLPEDEQRRIRQADANGFWDGCAWV